MPFTSTTIKKLRELNLEQTTFDRILEIFEEAHLSKPKKKGCADDRRQRGTRLPDDWALPDEWRKYALRLGLRPGEVAREAGKFKNHWLNAAGAKGLKLRWDLTWQTWCEKALGYMGREPILAEAVQVADGPDSFTDATWKAIGARIRAGAPWNPAWGPPPGRMDCKMPVEYL